MSTKRTEKVRLAVDAILLALYECKNSDEREEIAKEVNRLDSGGARQALADLSERAWETG